MGKIQKQDIKTVAELTNAGATAADLPNDDQIFVSALNINKTLKDAIADGDIGGSGGELNFIQLSNASWHGENGTAGFATYKDAAQSRPQDGTGGTASVTITTSNTNPLSGNNSLIISKPAGNLQGEGVSVGFAIDRASRARVLKIEFDYLVNSGTFNAGTGTSDSDLIVYIFDVDAGQLIEPSTFKLYANATNIADRFSGYFQTSASSTNYRLIFHVATTNSSAWSLKVDNVIVAPSKYVYGTPITDWVQYTPQFNTGFTVGTGGQAFNKWYWRRVGDSIQIHGGFRFGTSGFSMGSGDFQASLPSGLSFDSSKLTWQVDRIGVFDTHDSNQTNMREVGAVYVPSTSNTFRFIQRRVDNTSGAVNANFPFTWAADDELYCRIEAPIQGWSSSVKMSDEYDGREVVFIGGVTTQTVATGTIEVPKILTLPVARDTCACYNPSTGVFKVPSSGFYRISGRIGYSLDSSYFFRLGYSINSTSNFTKFSGQVNYSNANAFVFNSIDDVVYLTAGHEIRFGVSHNNPTNIQAPSDARLQAFSIERISSPQTIAMGESINVLATNSSGQSLPNATTTTITGWTKQKDTHNAFNASTGVFTAPVSGFYEFSLMLTLNSAANNLGGEFSSDLVSGHGKIAATFAQASGTYFMTITGSKTIYLNAGQTASATGYVSGLGGARNLYANADFNWLKIKRVGN